jgi:signal transduction histidine kinase
LVQLVRAEGDLMTEGAMHDEAASTLELPEMLRRTTRDLVRALNAHAGAAWHLSHTGDQLIPVAGYHIPKVLQTASIATIPISAADCLIQDAAELRRPIYSSDSAKDPRFQYPWARLLPHKSILVLPLSLPSTGKIVGGLAIVWTEEGHEFSSDEIRFAEAIAQQAGNTVENAQVLSELRVRERRLSDVLQATRELFSPSLTLSSLAQTIADVAIGLVDGGRADVRIAEAQGRLEEQRGLRAAAGSAAIDERAEREWAQFVDTISGTVAGTGEPIVIRTPDPDRDSTGPQATLKHLGYRGLLAVPLKLGLTVHGTLTIATGCPEGLSAADLSPLTAFAAQAALAIEHVRRHEPMNRSGAEPTDPATARASERGRKVPLLQADRLGPARQLARGVAHTLNNPLSVILGRAQLALRMRPNDPDLRRQLTAIEQAAVRSAETVRRLQVLTGLHSAAPRRPILPADLFAEIRASVQALPERAPAGSHSAVIEIREVGSIPAIAGDFAELQEALMNLVVNALEATPPGGTVRLTAATEPGAVRIVLEDTGLGMAPTVATQIFDPFFTTKGPAHAGLGLSLVSGIVERHSGTLAVETAEGQGTTFTIRLPTWTEVG